MAVRYWVAVVVAAMLVAGASGQTQDCTSAYNYLTTCLSYVSGNVTTPNLACCSGINYLNINNADCLCQIVKQYNNGTTPGVNVTRALELPSKCGVVVDTVKCPALALPPGAAVAPTPPYLSPPGAAPSGASGPSAPPGSSTAPGSSAAPIVASPLMPLLAALAVTQLLWIALTAT